MDACMESDSAQQTFEYVLVIGLVVVAFVAGMLGVSQVVDVVVGHACTSVDTAKAVSATVGSCIG